MPSWRHSVVTVVGLSSTSPARSMAISWTARTPWSLLLAAAIRVAAGAGGSHSSGVPFSLASSLVPLAMSSSSGKPLVLQSTAPVPARMTRTSQVLPAQSVTRTVPLPLAAGLVNDTE